MMTRKNRQTGTMISVGRAEDLGVDPSAGPWATICEDHGLIVNHRTRELAESHAPDPLGWCEGCREDADARSGGDWEPYTPSWDEIEVGMIGRAALDPDFT